MKSDDITNHNDDNESEIVNKKLTAFIQKTEMYSHGMKMMIMYDLINSLNDILHDI